MRSRDQLLRDEGYEPNRVAHNYPGEPQDSGLGDQDSPPPQDGPAEHLGELERKLDRILQYVESQQGKGFEGEREQQGGGWARRALEQIQGLLRGGRPATENDGASGGGLDYGRMSDDELVAQRFNNRGLRGKAKKVAWDDYRTHEKAKRSERKRRDRLNMGGYTPGDQQGDVVTPASDASASVGAARVRRDRRAAHRDAATNGPEREASEPAQDWRSGSQSEDIKELKQMMIDYKSDFDKLLVYLDAKI